MYRRKPKKPEIFDFPSSLEGLDFKINDEGQLRHISDDSPFKFEVKEKNRPYNEAHYEALLAHMGDIVEEKLQNCGLVRLLIPADAKPENGDIHTKIYMSPNALQTTDKLMLLIPPSNIRVGQWSRRVMVDDSIYNGSMLQTITRAREDGYEVFIFNPNENFWWKGRGWSNLIPTMRRPKEIPGSATPEIHCHTVFKQYIMNAKASKIAIIASNWGSHCIMQIFEEDFDFFRDKVQAMALINTVHSKDSINGAAKHVWLRENVANWVASEEKFGTLIEDPRFGCKSISSAASLSDYILPCALEKILEFFRVKLSSEPATYSDEEEDNNTKLTTEEEAELNARVDMTSVFDMAKEQDWSL